MTESEPESVSEPDAVVHGVIEGGIATLTLDSPANRNALSARLIGELSAHLSVAGLDPSVRAVVIAHTSNTFCAGADLAESAAEGGPAAGTARLVALLRQILELPKPVMALVQGNVRAGGIGVVAACDLAIVGQESSFAFTEVRLGLAPAIISLTVLPRLTDRAASRAFLTGERFDAAEAARIGLVTEASDDPVTALAVVTDAFLACSPQGLAETKFLTTRSMLADFDDAAAHLAETSARLFASAEAREGVTAFMERRPPAWATPPDPS